MVDPAADLQRVPRGRGEPRLPPVVALSHQRSRRPSRLFARRRRVLQLIELGEPPSLPDVVDARHPSRVARADELRRWVAADGQGELFPTPTLAVEIATCEDCLPYGEVCPQYRRKGLWIFRAMDHSCLCRAVAFITPKSGIQIPQLSGSCSPLLNSSISPPFWAFYFSWANIC